MTTESSRGDPAEVSTDPLSYQTGIALRFLDRLASLGESERTRITQPADLTAYEAASALIQTLLRRPAKPGTSSAHPTGGPLEVAYRADRYLDTLEVTGELWELARQAVRAILVRHIPDAQRAARVVYEPFERLIPYASLR